MSKAKLVLEYKQVSCCIFFTALLITLSVLLPREYRRSFFSIPLFFEDTLSTFQRVSPYFKPTNNYVSFTSVGYLLRVEYGQDHSNAKDDFTELFSKDENILENEPKLSSYPSVLQNNLDNVKCTLYDESTFGTYLQVTM
jgi:hypothetical protein